MLKQFAMALPVVVILTSTPAAADFDAGALHTKSTDAFNNRQWDGVRWLLAVDGVFRRANATEAHAVQTEIPGHLEQTIGGEWLYAIKDSRSREWTMGDLLQRGPVKPTFEGEPPIAPDGPPRVTDPALAPFANFTIQIASDFIGGFGSSGNGYDRAAHKYDPSYINPRRYVVKLDAQLGLALASQSTAALSLDFEDPPEPTTIAEFQQVLRFAEKQAGLGADLDLDGGSGGGAKFYPDDLVAYLWVIKETGGPYVDSQLRMRPQAMEKARFEVPRPGGYDVWLRVVFADGRQGESRAHFEFRDWFIASIGDSAASGQGNPDQIGTVDINLGGGLVCRNTSLAIAPKVEVRMSNEPVWTEKKAHRSMKSGPALAALSLQHSIGQTWQPKKQINLLSFDKVVFASFARSGATILKGLIDPQDGDNDFIGAGQIEELRRTAAGRRIDALMISISGNDAGFAGVLAELVTKDSVFRKELKFLGPGDDAAARRAIETRLDELLGVGLPSGEKGVIEVRFDTLRNLVNDLRENPGLGEVYISGYPTSLFQFRDASGQLAFKACEVFSGPDLDISDRDGEVIRSRGLLLNALIKRKAEEYGWHYVDVEADFEGRGYCAMGGTRFWVHAQESCERQGDFEGTMHPNHLGQAAYALRLSQAIRQHTFPRGPIGPLAPSKAAPQGPAAPINN